MNTATYKTLRLLRTQAFLILLLLMTPSCGSDEPKISTIKNPSGNTENNKESAEIAAAISKSVKAKASYNDYYFTLQITISPNPILHKYDVNTHLCHGKYTWENVYDFENISKAKTTYSKDGDIVIEYKWPFQYGFLSLCCHLEDEEDYNREYFEAEDTFVKADMYLASYEALKKKNPDELSAGERELLKDLRRYLNEYLGNLAYQYDFLAYVDVADHSYRIGTWGWFGDQLYLYQIKSQKQAHPHLVTHND